jgi:hypothetical protein
VGRGNRGVSGGEEGGQCGAGWARREGREMGHGWAGKEGREVSRGWAEIVARAEIQGSKRKSNFN